jgi:hypothetical protein
MVEFDPRFEIMPGTGIDRGGVLEAVDVKLVAHFLEKPQLRLPDRPVGRRDVAGQRIGRLPQPVRQVLPHQPEQRVEPFFLGKEIATVCDMSRMRSTS